MKKMPMTAALILALCLCLATPVLAAPAAAYNTAYAETPVCDSSQSYLNNLELAAAALDGYEIGFGETFSFNDVVGPRTQQAGYRIALNGRGTRVRGGGVSQAATTLNLAAMDFDWLVIEDYDTYDDKFVGGYVDDPSLAVITDYANDHDYVFTSWYPGTVTIEAWVINDTFCCALTGVEDGSYYPPSYQSGTLMAIGCTPMPVNVGQSDNIRLCYGTINHVYLSYGDIFSFNEIVGPRTKSAGYVSAVNGRGVTVVGGGVAQVASTIYLAVQQMDSITVDRVRTYGDRFTGDYVNDPADAIVTDYNAGTDFSFTYYGPGTLELSFYEENDWLYCELIEY